MTCVHKRLSTFGTFFLLTAFPQSFLTYQAHTVIRYTYLNFNLECTLLYIMHSFHLNLAFKDVKPQLLTKDNSNFQSNLGSSKLRQILIILLRGQLKVFLQAC